MSKKTARIVISTSTFATGDPKPLDRLKRTGSEVILNPFGRRLTSEELKTLAADATGLIAGSEKLNEDIFRSLPKLRVISRCGAGLDTVDLKAAHRRNIIVLNTPDAPKHAVAELAIGFMLSLVRRTAEADRSLRAGQWKPLMGSLLSGKTIGIIGLGRIGQQVVRLLEPFQCKFLARERAPNREFMKRHKIKLANLTTLLRFSDVISLHLTLDNETRRMIGAKEIGLLKPGSILINTSRGELVDESALVAALQSGQLGGAGLDVFETEPYQGPLLECPNTLLTCHMGSYATEARTAMESQAVDNLIHALRSLKR